MRALAISDEEEVIGLGRVNSRFEGCCSRITNRTNWEPLDYIRVVRRRRQQIFFRQVSVEVRDTGYYGWI